MNWVIKAIYPLGGHIVTYNGGPLRFTNKQEATDKAEMLNAQAKNDAARNKRFNDTTYIVVEKT